jgi:aminodeoxyfutalosine deaminase
MRKAGVRVTINTDDPMLFGCSLADELLTAADLLGLAADGVLELQHDAVLASFAPPSVRTSLLNAIEAHRSWPSSVCGAG